jgi:hypothetical protein
VNKFEGPSYVNGMDLTGKLWVVLEPLFLPVRRLNGPLQGFD